VSLDLAMQLVVAEEAARLVTVGLTSKTTRIIDYADQTLDPGEWFTILDKTGRGVVEEFHVRSPSTSFRISVSVDGETIINLTYDGFREIQQNSPSISAFAELDENGNPTGFYIVSMRAILHRRHVTVKLQNTSTSPTTFSRIFAKHTSVG